MAAMHCACMGVVPPCLTVKENSSRGQGKRMQVTMRRSSMASSNRLSLLHALSQQAAAQSQRSLENLATEIAKYVSPPRSVDARNLEEALMSVPDLESIPYDLIRRAAEYEIREVKSYVVAETTMSGRSGFDFSSSGQAFNTLAAYLFGKNSKRSEMSMTTPVLTNRRLSGGEKMDMTTPVIQEKGSGEGPWRMSFVLPAKYSEDPPIPEDAAVTIRRVPGKKVAVAVFAGFVTDEEVKRREQALRRALLKDPVVRVKADAQAQVAQWSGVECMCSPRSEGEGSVRSSGRVLTGRRGMGWVTGAAWQYNPPFTLPFQRRNEVALEIEDVFTI